MTGWTRRDMLGGAALLALVLGVPAGIASLSDLADEDVPTDRQRRMAFDVSQLVIPRSDTPGAADVGVGDFLILALAHGLSGTRAPLAGGAVTAALRLYRRRDGTLNHLAWLEAELDRRAGGDFLRWPLARRAAVLAALDSESFPPGPPQRDPSPWQAIKGLILTGYYTSEAGGARELRYELVPGRYVPDMPLRPNDRAWSSDWTAVEFG